MSGDGQVPAGPPLPGSWLRPSAEQPPDTPGEPGGGTGHPAVDAALRAIANVADLSAADQIAEYEAAHRTLREVLATIDQS